MPPNKFEYTNNLKKLYFAVNIWYDKFGYARYAGHLNQNI
jgi:hypothetical protein